MKTLFRSSVCRPLRALALLSGCWLLATVCGAADATMSYPEWFRKFTTRERGGYAQAQATAEEKLAAARAAKDEREEAYALLALGIARSSRSDFAGKARHTAQGLAIAERLGDVPLLSAALLNAGNAAFSLRDFPRAITFYQRSFDHHTRAGLPVNAAALSNLSRAYRALGDLPRALDYARQALALFEFKENGGDLISVLGALAQIEREVRDFPAARTHYRRALELERSRPGSNRTDIADIEEQLARTDFHEGLYAEALAAFEKIIRQRRTLRGKNKLSTVLIYTAETLVKLGRPDEAWPLIQEARGYVESQEITTLRESTYRVLAEVHAARGEFAAAYEAFQRYHDLTEAAAGEAAKTRAAELAAQFDFAEQQRAIAALEQRQKLQDADLRAQRAELARVRTQRWAVGFGLGAVAVALGAWGWGLRARRRADQRILAETCLAKEAAERADLLKSRLLGIASHDLKAPLRAMLLRADQLQPAVAPAGAEALAGLRTDGERMLTLVRDLLDIAAIEAGELKLRLASCELCALAAEVVAAAQPHAQQKLIALHFTSAANAVFLPADRPRLAQALTNLVDNAVKFSPPGASVHVSLGVDEGSVRLAVRDAGPGLSAADFARMFQPFQTLSAVPTAGEPSSGLGLHITREIVARHGGRIDVDSAPGAGATFTIVLPLTTSPA
jgi:signal transduction histidine kinase